MPEQRRDLERSDWEELIWLAHTDRAKVFEVYSSFYLSTHGERYWSDTHQLGVYLDHYHEDLDRQLGATGPATEMITELDVPRDELTIFMTQAAEELRSREVPVIYGAVRLIVREEVSVLAWAREDFACIVFNLHTEHSMEGIATSSGAFCALIDLALSLGGSFFLTYHKWASRTQVEQAHPRFAEFLAKKKGT